MSKEIVLSTEKLSKSFSNAGVQQHVLKNLDVQIYEGDFTVIMGASGAGKSTLLYALSGMDRPTLGRIHFYGADISSYSNNKLALLRRRDCGFVFQQIYLMDSMSVMDNILAAGLLVSKDRKKLASEAGVLLERVGIGGELFKKFPTQLSGGEAQRVGIVRALMNEPKFVFADEPTGQLNSSSGKAVLDVLTEVHNRGQNIVMVTHDLKSARRGTRILYLQDGSVKGECQLGEYQPEDETRNENLNAFLAEMGW